MAPVDYDSASHEPRTNAEQSETRADFRVSFESGGDLYFMQAGDAVKIGRTRNVKSRLRMTQTHCPMEVRLLGHVAGAGESEGVWHYAFSATRRCGEWFAFTPELEAAIAAAMGGREWIAELEPTDADLAIAKRDWARYPDEMERVFGSPLDYARHCRRHRVADREEIGLTATPRTPQAPQASPGPTRVA